MWQELGRRWSAAFRWLGRRGSHGPDEVRIVHGLLALAETLGSEAAFEARMRELCRIACELIDCDRSSIFEFEDGYYRARFNHGNPPDLTPHFARFRVRADDRLVSRAMETRDYVLVNEASRSPLVNQRTARFARIRAIVVAPMLREDGSPRGFMTGEYNERMGRFSELQSLILMGAARIAAASAAREEEYRKRGALEQRVRVLERLEAIGRLAGGVAHDFNNLLTVVLSNCEVLEPQVPEPARPALAELRAASERAAGLTQQLLAFGRRQILEPRSVDVHAVVEGMNQLLRRLLPQSIDIRVDGSLGEFFARVDPGEFEQVVMNLALNARDAMPRGGRLTIETGTAVLDADYCREHPGAEPGEYVVLAVSDTGAGIASDVAEKIFEPFFSTKPTQRGTGLGLATVYGIVQQSRGHVWLYSEPGKGTSFKVYLPRMQGPAEEIVPDPPPVTSLDGDETVLIADDVAAVRRVARLALEAHGYTVLEASHPDEALERARAHDGPIHLLITDVVMPGASGRDLAERLARTRPELRVLYVSGYAENAIVHQGALETGVSYLAKPFTPSVLARRVREELDGPPSPEGGPQADG